MQIDTAGTYTLKYTAEDECGNVTEVTREVVAEQISYRTVLYTDGTFIINEKSTDQAANEALHGVATNEYIPFNPNGSTDREKYIFTTNSSRPWNGTRSSIKSVEIGATIAPTSTAYWFYQLENATSFDLGNLNTANVTAMNWMFYNCKKLVSLDLSGFNTTNVTTMANMFMGCIRLATLNVTSFNTSNVTDMRAMFYNCSSLANIDVSNFDTKNVEIMASMFERCSSLSSIDVSRFDTSKVTSMASMFASMNFSTLDLSNFVTSMVTEMQQMFANSRLVTIYASNSFNVTQVTNSGDMFGGCNLLVGGAGTRRTSPNPTDKTYARIDNPPDAPGYFTAKA